MTHRAIAGHTALELVVALGLAATIATAVTGMVTRTALIHRDVASHVSAASELDVVMQMLANELEAHEIGTLVIEQSRAVVVRFDHLAPEPLTIRYDVIDGALRRRTWHHFYGDVAPTDEVLLTGVDAFDVEALGPDDEWVRSWPARITPRAIAISLKHRTDPARRLVTMPILGSAS